MSTFSAASEVILRHDDQFMVRCVLFAGDIQDTLPCQFSATDVQVWTTHYHHWQALSRTLGHQAQFGLLADAEKVQHCDTLIYYWPKSKQEAQFQLYHLLSLLPVGVDLFVVGENRSGVRSAENLLAECCPMQKIDSARRCGLYYGRLEKSLTFDLTEWWHEYHSDDIRVTTLPGVFSRDRLDMGSQLLLSTLDPSLQGDLLDVGCGAGVLAATLAKHAPAIRSLTLSDINAAALAASKATLAANDLEGQVIASNIFSDIQGKFDLIISNPPFHDGLQTSLNSAEALIRGAIDHLHIGGQLRIVANAFLPYPDWLDAVFGHHEVLAQTSKFKVYKAVRQNTRRPR